MNMSGNLEAEIECVSISSTSSDMGPLVVRRKNKSLEVEITKVELLMSPPLSMGKQPVYSVEEKA